MDRRAIIAIVLCAAFLLLYRPLLKLAGLDHYLEPPARPPARVAVDSSGRDTAGAIAGGEALSVPPATSARSDSSVLSIGRAGASDTAAFSQTFQLETPLYLATFSDHGALLLTTELKHYASAHVTGADGKHQRYPRGTEVPSGERVVLGGGPLFQIQSLATLDYAVAESLDASGQKRALIFTADHPSGLRVRQVYRVRPGTYALDLSVELHGVPADWRASDYTLSARSWPTLTEVDPLADGRALRATSLVGTSLRREGVGGLLKSEKRFEGSAVWAAVQSRYFINAIVVEAGPARAVVSAAQRTVVPPTGSSGKSTERDYVVNSLVMGLPSESNPVHRFVLYVGPSEYFMLSDVGHGLQRAVDLGWQWVLPFSRALLQLLNWLYGLLHNYGLAILAIATLVRLLLHPLNMMSMKSMRAMQKLQPELERIRTKYKNDPQAMNTAVMALYKDNKVNPAGGCLPMVIQMPLFIALYQVLFNAIELRQAPFVAWIHDLSAPDELFSVAGFPIRLLPLIMLGSGFLAQLVTPTDPRQRSTMYLMNVVMLVFFYNLPSGLVLYWTIMNLLTALQQWMILRQDDVVEAPAQAAVVIPKRAKGRKAARS
jgi:YidC/Oxa1 family membrane protein insertase